MYSSLNCMEAIMKKAFGFFAMVLLASTVWATPANTAVLDGRPIEYDATDLRGSFAGASAWGPNGTLTNLYVTWDATYVYIALQAWQAGNNKLVVLVDVDPGAGTGATTTTNWTNVEPSFIQYNDYGWVDGSGFGLDYMAASEGFYNNCIRINYDGADAPTTNNLDSLFDNGNGATPAGTPVDMASLNDATACPHKGFEVRIPWTNLYEGTRFGTVEPGKTVPRGASLRLLAGVHNNDPASAYSSPDTIPNQVVEDYTNGIVTSATYLDVPLDTDTNGIPDMLGGDVNGPYLRAGAGAAGGTNIYLAFNEPVTVGTVQNTGNWTVGGVAPITAVAQGAYGVLLGLASPIADTNLVLVQANGVQDADLNSRLTEYCLAPAASGIPQAVTVTFQVATNSGMGISASHAKPSAFFVNGSSLPLEWGYPPLETVPLTAIPGSNGWTAASVIFPPGSPTELSYKYSGRISGTNNYEAIRLTDFADAARKLVLNTNGTPMTVVDYLGAAAAPLRNPANTNSIAHTNLYKDVQRGDAGVRVRREILFQLDLSLRKRDNLQRVMVMGSDPLRGFNSTGDDASGYASDYPDNSAYLTWTNAGIQLVDDGTLGDSTPGDGIFSRLWSVSTNGFDAAVEPDAPSSLVGGRYAVYVPTVIPGTQPYLGDTWWSARRSPRSFGYKFYVLTDANNHYESPSSNIEYYILDPTNTGQIVLSPFLWDNDGLPPPPATNAPVIAGIVLTDDTARVYFENVLTEGSHGVKIATNLLTGFDDYGLRAIMGGTNGGLRQWSAIISQILPDKEFYAPYAGQEPDPLPGYWEPSFIPATATTWRIHFSQYKNNLKGGRTLAVTGPFAAWGDGTPMTFLGDGHWVADVPLAAGTETVLEYKIRNGDTWLDGDNLKAIRGGGGATWTPDQPTTGALFTVTFDTTGTALAGATNVNIHLGYDPGWIETSDLPMTNTAGSVWEYAAPVSTSATVSVNWVFNGYIAGPQVWYSPANWEAFMDPFVNP